jgi:hypothetical protein
VGAGVSFAFGLEARKQEKEPLSKKKDAEDTAEREKEAAARADNERNAAIRARNDLKTAHQRTNRTLAESLLAPITADRRNELPTPYEVATLWPLVELRRTEVAFTFLEEATRTPLPCSECSLGPWCLLKCLWSC